MFKRGNYSKRALSTFEIVGSFIVDLYYNGFYQEAKKIRIEGRVESITDGYKHAIKAYLNSFENPESYRKTIVGIHKYYYTTTRFESISFSECVNEIVKHFIPDDFFDSTTNQQRDGILRMVLMNSVKQFSSDVLCSNLLDTLIDNHSEQGIVRRMQDKMVQALMFEREKMFQKIFNVSNKPKDGGDFTIVMKMKSEVVKLVKENYSLTSKYAKLKNKALELLQIVKEQKDMLEKLKEPDNRRLEQSEQENDRQYDENRRIKYDSYHPEQKFDKYQAEQHDIANENRDDRTIYIQNDQSNNNKINSYNRSQKINASYHPEPPPDNIIRFEPYSTPSSYNTTTPQNIYGSVNSTHNKYDTYPNEIREEGLVEPTIENNYEEYYNNTNNTNTQIAINHNVNNEKEEDIDPVNSMSPSDNEFFESNSMLNIN
jgi:hypothetical protein